MSRARSLPHYEHEEEIVSCIQAGMTYQETLDKVYGIKNRYSVNSLSRFLNRIECFSRNYKGGSHTVKNIYNLPVCQECKYYTEFANSVPDKKPIPVCLKSERAIPRDLKLSPVWCEKRLIK